MPVIPRITDISHYNSVGWPKPTDSTKSGFEAAKAAGIWGAIHKATEGTTYKDPNLPARRTAARQAGMLFGTYHFLRTRANIEAQVDAYLKYAAPNADELMALDWETHGVAGTTPTYAEAKKFLELIIAKTGRKAVLYSGNVAKEKIPTKDAFFGSHRLWLAQYSSVAKVQRSWAKYWIWQYTGDNTGPQPHGVNGIWIGNKRNGIDLNDYQGTLAQLRQEWAS